MNIGSESDKPVLDPRNHATWTVAGFIVALLALVMSFAQIHNTSVALVVTQLEVAQINKKVQEIDERARAPAEPPSAAALQPQR
jgi:hypothetical protein